LPSVVAGQDGGVFQMPSTLSAEVQRTGRQAWAASLPEIVADLEDRWSIDTGPPFEPGGQTAWVAPAQSRAGTDLVVKLGWRHPEASHEAAGLLAWHGHGAVHLHAEHRYRDTVALLLERCRPGTTLHALPPTEQDDVVAALLRRLWTVRPAAGDFPTLQSMCDMWASAFEQRRAAQAVDLDHGLLDEGICLFRELPRSADDAVLLCTDLHAGNVLAAQREAWLVIDPKPHMGDPTYDVLQHMLNCVDRLQANPRGFARQMASRLDLDEGRLLLWLFARCVQGSFTWPGLRQVARKIAPS
jgi:streptomycin 6-kinase